MWVYLRTEKRLWTVGYYRPDGKFETDDDFDDRDAARDRVAYLNGGSDKDRFASIEEEIERLRQTFDDFRGHYGLL